jgi:hypothetical protein
MSRSIYIPHFKTYLLGSNSANSRWPDVPVKVTWRVRSVANDNMMPALSKSHYRDRTLGDVRSTMTGCVRSIKNLSGLFLLLTERTQGRVRSWDPQRPIMPSSCAVPATAIVEGARLVAPQPLPCALTTNQTRSLSVRSALKHPFTSNSTNSVNRIDFNCFLGYP